MNPITVPIVFIPRYTTYAGGGDFVSLPVNVAEYCELRVNVWRGTIVGPGGTFGFNLQASFDQKTWGDIFGSDEDPGANTEALYEFLTIRLPYLRSIVRVAGVSTVVTCYAFADFTVRRS